MSGRIVFKNTLWNIVGKIIPIPLGILAIPFLIDRLGVELFGLLSLSWVVLGYFSLFDLGMGKATTKFIAEALGEGRKEDISQVVWISFTLHIVLGMAGAIGITLLAPFLIALFSLSAELIPTAKESFFILAFAVPAMMIVASMKGVLAGFQRYDLINFAKIPLNISLILIPVAGAFLGASLPVIITWLVLGKFAGAVAYSMFVWKLIPNWFVAFSFQFSRARALLAFSSWVGISNAIWSFLANIDRFFIGSLVSVAAVSFYTAPFVVTRLLILPESMVPLFPAFSSFKGEQRGNAVRLFLRAAKHLFFAIGIAAGFLVLFAEPLLNIWLGEEFARESSRALQFLSIGVFALSFSSLADNLIKGFGKPDWIAKLHLIELPLYLGAAFYIIESYGVTGAAALWMIRAIFDAGIMYLFSLKIMHLPIRKFLEEGVGRTLLVLAGMGIGVGMLLAWTTGALFFGAGALLFFAVLVLWKFYILDQEDALFFHSFFQRILPKSA